MHHQQGGRADKTARPLAALQVSKNCRTHELPG